MTQPHRVIKHPDKPLPGIEVIDYCARDSSFALLEFWGIEQDMEHDEPELELLEVKPSRIDRNKRSWSKR